MPTSLSAAPPSSMLFPVPLNKLDASEHLLATSQSSGPSSLPTPNPLPSFWLTPDANPLADHGSTGPLTETADICIIGSGISGISAALHLSILSTQYAIPLKVVVLEARQFCSGATGRNGGHLVPNKFLHFQRNIARFGLEDAKKAMELERYSNQFLLDLIQQHGWASDIDLVAGGKTILLLTEVERQEYLRDYQAAKQHKLNLDNIEWLGKAETKARFGASFASIREPAHTLWPLKLITKLFYLTQSSSPDFQINLHTHTPVLSVKPSSSSHSDPQRRWTLSTPRGEIQSRFVIHTTNAYASHLLPHLQGPPGIIPARGQVIATRSIVPANKLTNSSWTANEGFEYWFPRPVVGNPDVEKPLVILGGGREVPENHELYVTDDSRVDESVSEALRRFLPAFFPGRFDERDKPEMEWTGIMGFTVSGDPLVGPVVDPSSQSRFDGQYISAGFSGHGMTRATACAEVVAQMVMADAFPTKVGAWSAPSWLPSHYLTT